MPLCRVIVASFALGAVGRAAEGQLASRSPFLPPQSAASNAPTQNAALEFGGYIDTPSEGRLYRITVKDKDAARRTGGASTGAWVKLNERNPELDVMVKVHDESQKPATLTVEHQGKTLTLAEKESKVVSGGPAAAAMPPPMQPPLPPVQANVPAAVTQAVVLNPSPADEQKRLEAVAAEVARRRALREQATQTVGAPQNATPQQQVPLQPQAQPQQMRGYPQGVPVPANMPGQQQRR
jgi:hypothetical protein